MRFPQFKKLPLVWLTLVIEISILGFVKQINPDFEVVSWFAVFVHVLIVLIILSAIPVRIKAIFILAFLVRLMFMVWDIYARGIFVLPNSGVDTESYYVWAKTVGDNLAYLIMPIHGGVYSKIIGIVFYITGPMRLLAQYINVLLGLWVVLVVYKTLILLEIKPTIIRIVTFLAAFFPNSIVMSAIMLREIFPTFFVAISIYNFILWYKFGEKKRVILSLVMLGMASVFHSGVMGIFLGYAWFFLFYNKEFNVYRFSSRTLLFSIVLAGLSYVAIVYYSDVLFKKFSNIDEISDIYLSTNRRAGGAVYLTDMTITNPLQFLIYGPVRAFYFLTSPLPMDWRGGADILTFLFDSMLYFWVIFYFLKNRKWFNQRKKLITAIVLMLIGVSLIFGFGVSNAGTAMRHRQKILPIFLVLAAVMLDEKKKATINVNQGLNC